MNILYVQQFNENDKLDYEIKKDVIRATFNDGKETFDFTDMPDGKAEVIQSDVFDFCPILSAERRDGDLYLELLNFISIDATDEEKFPEWQEVDIDGKD